MDVLKLKKGLLKSFFSIVTISLCTPIIAENIPDPQTESMDVITSGLNVSPMTRHDAAVEFKQRKDSSQVIEWADWRAIEILSLEGTFKVGTQEVTVLLGDLGSYKDPLSDVIDAQLETYHEAAIENIIADLSKSLSGLKDQNKIKSLRREIADLRTAKKAEIQWHRAKVIASYSELYDLSLSEDEVKNVNVQKRNHADMIDEFWRQPGRQKRSINTIEPFPERNLPGSLNAFPNNESIFSSIFNVKSAKSLSLQLAGQALEALVPRAHAAGTLCGNKQPYEIYCPPDNNFVPDNPNWYVYITQPYAEYPDYLQGMTYTLVDWSTQGVKAFTGSSDLPPV